MNEPVLSLTGICKSYNPGQANEVRRGSVNPTIRARPMR